MFSKRCWIAWSESGLKDDSLPIRKDARRQKGIAVDHGVTAVLSLLPMHGMWLPALATYDATIDRLIIGIRRNNVVPSRFYGTQ
jgi:hypothetical protein